MRRALLSLLFCTCIQADIESDIDALFAQYSRPDVPGAAVLVLQDGASPIRKVYGLADLAPKRSTSASTNYRLASLSKQFTALAALILVDRGKLDLEETLQDIFPDFPSYGRSIRVRHLLHHTSGLKSYESLVPSGFKGQVDDTWVLETMKQQRSTNFTPGSQYSYSNTGYCVLSQVIAKRSGKAYGKFVVDEVFKPLGMDDSQVTDKTPPPIPDRAYGYTASGGGFTRTDQSTTSATQGDGGIYTSLTDYQKWITGFGSLVSLPTQALVFAKGALNNGSAVNYGAGWTIGTYRGFSRYSHTGSSIGFRTAVEHFPHNGLVVLVLVNRANATPWNEARRVVDLVL